MRDGDRDAALPRGCAAVPTASISHLLWRVAGARVSHDKVALRAIYMDGGRLSAVDPCGTDGAYLVWIRLFLCL
jgi:hypothetical protein